MDLSHIRQAVARFWPVWVLAVLAGIVLVAIPPATAASSYRSTMVLSVQPPPVKGSTQSQGFNPDSLTFLLPAIEKRLDSDALKTAVKALVPGGADFSIATTPEPGSGVITVTATSEESAVVQPALAAYSRLITSYPDQVSLPVAITLVEPAKRSEQVSQLREVAIAGVEGLILGAGVGALVCLLLDRLRRNRRHGVRLGSGPGERAAEVAAVQEPGGEARVARGAGVGSVAPVREAGETAALGGSARS